MLVNCRICRERFSSVGVWDRCPRCTSEWVSNFLVVCKRCGCSVLPEALEKHENWHKGQDLQLKEILNLLRRHPEEFDEGGLYIHCRMQVNADGQGPVPTSEMVAEVCWCVLGKLCPVYPYREVKYVDGDFMPRVNGVGFRCRCGANLFRLEVVDGADIYVCKACSERYRAD